MEEEKINALAKYLGSKCEIRNILEGGAFKMTFSITELYIHTQTGKDKEYTLMLLLKPLSSLTLEGYWEMQRGCGYSTSSLTFGVLDSFKSNPRLIPDVYASWLRNVGGYYLGEEPIKEFVKLEG